MVEKNYRLQDIQLSKNPPGGLWPFGVGTSLSRPANPITSSEAHGLEDEVKTGGEYRARTGDLLVANQALSQLS